MERLKPFSQILEPDSRMPLRVMVNRESGESRPRQIKDHYEQVAVVALSESVPEEVRNAFVTAQHIAIYSWFAYALVPAALLQTFAALELALKVRMKGEKSRGLRERLEVAKRRGWVDSGKLFDRMEPFLLPAVQEGEGIESLSREEARSGFLDRVIPSLVESRNTLAHGMYGLWPHAYFDLHLVAAMIEQLFEPAEKGLKTDH